MTDSDLRSVSIERIGSAQFRATNKDGISIEIGAEGAFTPVELLLAAIASCGAIDMDYILRRRAEPETMTAVSEGTKINDEHGNRMTDIKVTYDVAFPEGEAGDSAREHLPRALRQSHDRICTVTRTVITGAPVEFELTE